MLNGNNHTTISSQLKVLKKHDKCKTPNIQVHQNNYLLDKSDQMEVYILRNQ